MGIARKTLEEKIATVERFRGYPSLPSDKSENKPDMTETGALGGNPQFTPLPVIMQKMEHMELQAWAERDAEREALHKEFQAVKRKEESKAYAQKWETNVTQETHDPIARVTAMLEQGKQTDGTHGYMDMLHGEITAGRANLNTYAKLNKAKGGYKKRMLEFVKTAPKYDGNPEKVFEWCEHLETHL